MTQDLSGLQLSYDLSCTSQFPAVALDFLIYKRRNWAKGSLFDIFSKMIFLTRTHNIQVCNELWYVRYFLKYVR